MCTKNTGANPSLYLNPEEGAYTRGGGAYESAVVTRADAGTTAASSRGWRCWGRSGPRKLANDRSSSSGGTDTVPLAASWPPSRERDGGPPAAAVSPSPRVVGPALPLGPRRGLLFCALGRPFGLAPLLLDPLGPGDESALLLHSQVLHSRRPDARDLPTTVKILEVAVPGS